MFSFDSFIHSDFFVITLLLILAFVLIALVSVASRFSRQRRNIRRQEDMQREVARRRRIRPSDKAEVFARDNYTCQICGISKDFLDSFCYGLGDYLLLETDHIQSVAQGGTGRDIDNLQCLCWRCNRKKGGRKTNEEVKELIDYGADYLRRY
ncbi:MAG: HNH endonuclease [Saccharofermentans sp.]|nr:HNH endonuclease [Saccharofermentans sp.]